MPDSKEKKDKTNTPPSSALSRSFKLFGMASKLAAKEVLQRVSGAANKKFEDLTPDQLKRRISQARVITESLSQLKGAAMKAGQLLSIDASGFLPPEALEILSQLQSQSTQMSFEKIESQLNKELGEDQVKKFKNISYRAVAAASIGQVHSALLENQKVAIKVQYPGISESIDSDLKILRKIVDQLIGFTSRKIETEGVFEELAKVLKLEADYRHEFSKMNEFKTLLSDDSRYIVPTPIADFSNSKILTMSFQEGATLTDWLKSSPTLEEKTQVATMVLDLFIREFTEFGMVQTDPNFANFLIQDEPLKLVLLDFGATINYDREFRTDYAQILNDITSKDSEKIFASAVKFELLDARESDEAKEAFKNMLETSMQPFDPDRQPFDFSNVDFEKQSRETAIIFSRSLHFSAPPRKIIFLHRKLGGIFNLLKIMNVRLNLTPYWQQMLHPKIKGN